MFTKEVEQIKSELIEMRRTIHENAEVGAHLPKTKAFVMEKLSQYGYEPIEVCESCITAFLKGGKAGKTLLLRADMDALPIEEKSSLPFAAQNGCMHACGHDMHTAMLLGAAKILKQHQGEMAGNIKFVFQPNEEGFGGAKAALEAGVLKQPHIDAGLALHVSSGQPTGLVLVGKNTLMAGCSFFKICVEGVGCHGAMAHTGVDPINVAAHIFLALQEIIAREVDPTAVAALTIGRFCSGEAANVIPKEAVLEGSVRAKNEADGQFILERIEQIALLTAKAFRASARLEKTVSVPPLVNDAAQAEKMANFAGEIFAKEKVVRFENCGTGSEDFAFFTKQIPCTYLLIGAGTKEENASFGKPMHNEAVVFSEDVLPLGTQLICHCAKRWLETTN